MDRRKFIGSSAVAAAAFGLGQLSLRAEESPVNRKGSKLMPFSQTVNAPDGDFRALLLHLGFNMWCDWPTEQMGTVLEEAIMKLPEKKRPDLKLRCEDDVWREVTDYAAAKGVNLLVVDVGEGIILPSHPELAVEGSWSVEKIRSEISRLNALGMEVVPKVNFSSIHNGWMKDYRHMLSSKPYYQMCEDVISDVFEIFGRPRFFHVGYDEEDLTYHHQFFSYRIMRTEESWWCDFLHIVQTVEHLGARPWVWSDYGWEHPDYIERCPKSVIQQDWYYDDANGGFDPEDKTNPYSYRLAQMWDMDKAGFDQVPCGSNWVSGKRFTENIGADDVFGKLMSSVRKGLSKEHLKGFMMAPWIPTARGPKLERIFEAIDIMAEAYAQ